MQDRKAVAVTSVWQALADWKREQPAPQREQPGQEHGTQPTALRQGGLPTSRK